MRSFKQHGFGHLLLIVILVVAAGIGGIAYVVYNRHAGSANDSDSNQTTKAAEVQKAPAINDSADLDSTGKTLDQFDPNAASQSDSNAIDSQTQAL